MPLVSGLLSPTVNMIDISRSESSDCGLKRVCKVLGAVLAVWEARPWYLKYLAILHNRHRQSDRAQDPLAYGEHN